MQEGLENAIRKDFEAGARCYQDSRLESLPEEELLILEEWISVFKQKEQKDEKGALDVLTETFYMSAALRNGFRPSEYIDSMSNAKIRHLRELQIEPDEILPSTGQIQGASDFIEFTVRLRNRLISHDSSAEFMRSLGDDSEYAFWGGCLLEGVDWENAKESFRIAVGGSIDKRMRIRALQNIAWSCVHLGEFDEAINNYNEIIELAEMYDTKELASKCLGYITALRDAGIDDPDSEFIFAPGTEEFAESEVLRQANAILTAKGASYINPPAPPSYLQQEIAKEKAMNEELCERIGEQSGIGVEELPAEVIDELVNAERNRILEKSPRQAIIDLYQAVANCLQCYIGSRFIPYAGKIERLPRYVESLAIYQWADLFSLIDKQGDKQITDKVVRLLMMPFQSFVADNMPSNCIPTLLSLGQNLKRIQSVRNNYAHQEGTIASGPPSRRQQIQELEEMHKLVLGQRDSDAIIKQIIRLGISKEV